jgi:hypothetical protein
MWNLRSKLLCTVRNLLALSVTLLVALGGSALGQEWTLDRDQLVEQPKPYSPYVDQHFPQRVFFGDTHHHSSFSVDSGMFGNTLGPDQSFRFARGEEVRSSSGLRVKLIRPLDFLVVSDHAEYLGLSNLLVTGNPRLLATEVGKEWAAALAEGGEAAWLTAVAIMDDFTTGNERFADPQLKRNVWDSVVDIASEFNAPGVFTAFNGYEWSSAPNGDNLHRVVIFRDGSDRVKQILPFSAFDSIHPEDLWNALAAYESTTGGQALAIPHNGNISNGVMFAETMSNGEPINKAYAEMRSRWEPLLEVTQMKGDGEAHPFLSTEDEFADFETWDFGNAGSPITPKQDSMLQYEYARSALKLGLRHEANLGVSPFKFGMIGSTDNHVSLSTTREENFFGKLPALQPSADRTDDAFVKNADGTPAALSWESPASGLAAIWARENTRESLFDAMARKEVYATTGSRITVRVFGGWDFKADEVERPDFAREGYRRGVPMGGDLTNGPAGKAPTFMIRSIRDPDGANLDRVQVIKGWLDKDGELHERIYDVAVSDGREIGDDGRAKEAVGSTVDVANATYTNSIGDAALWAHWKDPDFDPNQRAFYYVRVIEIPTPRWTAYDAKRFGIEMPEEVRMTVQDRAYTSPIWYTP